MANKTRKKSKYNIDHKYAIHFDVAGSDKRRVNEKKYTILDNGSVSKLGNPALHEDIQLFLENNGFKKVQGSGYENCEPMSKRKVFDIMNELFEKRPILDSTIPGSNQKCAQSIYITEIAGSHNYIKDNKIQSISFTQDDYKKSKKQIAFDIDSVAIKRDGKYPTVLYKSISDFLSDNKLVKEKQHSVYILNKSMTTQDAANILDTMRKSIPDFSKYCKECTITNVVKNTDYMAYREKEKKKDPDFWPQYVSYPIIMNGVKNHNLGNIPLDRKANMCIIYNTDRSETNDVSLKNDADKATKSFHRKLQHNGFYAEEHGIYRSIEPVSIGDMIDKIYASYDQKYGGKDSSFKQRMQNVYITIKESDILPSNPSNSKQSLSANAVKDAEELLSTINFDSDTDFENKGIK